MKKIIFVLGLLFAVSVMSPTMMAQTASAVVEEATLDTGNTAWMIVATVLVLLMTIPGLALFYGGLVRAKNVLSIIMQCMVCVCAITIIWVAFGYSWVFGTGFEGTGAFEFIGGFDKVFLSGLTLDAFGVHGIGGLVGSVLAGIFATQAITGAGGERGALFGDWNQLWVQIVVSVATIAYSAFVTFILFNIVDKAVGIRVTPRVEEESLDVYEHGETSYS